METFEFYQDQKVTTWDRVHFSITAPDLETAKAKLEAYRYEEIENDEGLGIKISHCEYQPDTSESMTVEDNGGCSTLEMFTKDGDDVMTNTPEPTQATCRNCSNCQQDTLKYAMIDIDGTNLEEGYSCSECGANFIGLDNQQVIETNPEITEDNE